MDEYLSKLRSLAKQKRLVPAEQIITQILIDFERNIPQKLSDANFTEIEKILLLFLEANNGNLSMQCSIRIANCLLYLYESTVPPKIWGLVNELSRKPVNSVLYAVGQVIDIVGKNSRSTIPGIVSNVLSKANSFSFLAPPCFVLISCYKADRADLSQYSSSIFDNFCLKTLKTDDEITILFGIRLATTLLREKSIQRKKFISFAQTCFTNVTTPEIVDAVSFFVAKLAFLSVEEITSNAPKNNGNDEWAIGAIKKETTAKDNIILASSFELFNMFKNHFPTIFSHYLDLLDPEIIQQNLEPLFQYVQSKHPSEIYQVISLFGPEVRKSFFDRIAKEKTPAIIQMNLLKSLQYNEKSIREVAALAFQLSSSQNGTQEAAGANFFSMLTSVDPHHASLYLETASLFLSNPPEDNPNHSSDLWGFSMIAIHILGALCTTTTLSQNSSASNRESIERWNELVDANNDHFQQFLNRALLLKNIFNIEFISAFWLMAVLPDSSIPIKETTRALNQFLTYVEQKIDNQNFNKDIPIQRTAACISLFLSRHPALKFQTAPKIYKLLISNPFLSSDTTNLAILIGAPYAMPQSKQLTTILHSIIEYFSKIRPVPSFLRSIVASPMPSQLQVSQNHYKPRNDTNEFEKPSSDVVFCSVPLSSLPYYIFKYFPAYISSLPQESVSSILSYILQIQKYSFSHTLILSLAQNQYTCSLLPSNIDELLLDTVKPRENSNSKSQAEQNNLTLSNGYEAESEVARLQITAESLALWGRQHKSGAERILKTTDKWRNPFKCFLIASFAAHHCFDNDPGKLIRVLQDLDDIALNTIYTPYALFSISTVLSFYTTQLAAMRMIDLQFPVFSNILHSQKSLRPYELSFLSSVLTDLLGVLSPEIQSEIDNPKFKSTIDSLKLFISSFSLLPMHYAKPAMFNTMRAVFAFARSLAIDSAKSMEFPSKSGVPISLKLAACGAFSDMLRVIQIHNDYFNLVPEVLVLLQRSKDKRASEFILAIARSFTSSVSLESEQSSNEAKQKLLEWLKIAKTVLTNNSLPRTGEATIESSNAVKVCCLEVLNTLLPIHAKMMNKGMRVGEILDDIMTSVIRGVETKRGNVLKASYTNLEQILTLYEAQKSESGNRILELYDSQFTIAVRIGFESDLGISGAFLRSYLKFHYDNLTKCPEDFQAVLTGYVKGLSSCRQRTESFFALASHICMIAKKNEMVQEQIKDFGPTIIQPMGNIIKKAMDLWSADPPDWIKISLFRCGFETFFKDLLSSFIWLQSHYGLQVIEPNILTNFVVTEINRSTEKWRVLAAFDGLATVFSEYASNRHCKSELTKTVEISPIENSSLQREFIDPAIGSSSIHTEEEEKNMMELQIERLEHMAHIPSPQTQEIVSVQNNNVITDADVKKALKAVLKSNHIAPQLLSAALPPFLVSCAAIISAEGSDPDTWMQLVNLSLQPFNPPALAYLITKKKDLCSEEVVIRIFRALLDGLAENLISEQNGQAMTLILDNMQPSVISQLVDDLFTSKVQDVKIKFAVLRALLIKVNSLNDNSEKSASEFGWRHFRNGGMQFFSYVFSRQPVIGAKIFLGDELSILHALCKNDVINTTVYLQFAHYGFQTLETVKEQIKPDKYNRTMKEAVIIAIDAIDKWGKDQLKGRDIIFAAVGLLSQIKKMNQDQLRVGFTETAQREQQVVIQLLEKQVQRKTHKITTKLTTFSTSVKRRKVEEDDDGEWETL